MDKASRRTAKRVPIVAKIEAQAGGFPFIALAENISEGGIFIHSANTLEEGAVVHLKFTLPDADKPIHVKGTVRHVSKGQSMGIRFDDLDAADRKAIHEFVSLA